MVYEVEGAGYTVKSCVVDACRLETDASLPVVFGVDQLWLTITATTVLSGIDMVDWCGLENVKCHWSAYDNCLGDAALRFVGETSTTFDLSTHAVFGATILNNFDESTYVNLLPTELDYNNVGDITKVGAWDIDLTALCKGVLSGKYNAFLHKDTSACQMTCYMADAEYGIRLAVYYHQCGVEHCYACRSDDFCRSCDAGYYPKAGICVPLI